jgi:hypothetical protein
MKCKGQTGIGIAMVLALSLTACGQQDPQSENSELDAAPSVGFSAGVNVNIDPLAIKQYIDQQNKAKSDAVSFIQGLSQSAYWKLNVEARKKNIRPYNVAVCNLAQSCFLRADEGSNYYFSTHVFNGTTYGVWGFRAGTFTNHGSGGWDNWSLIGCHDHQPGQGARPVRFEVCANP